MFGDFIKSGHKPTLLSTFFYSDMSFMVWVLLGPLAIHISLDLGLTGSQQYTMVVIPLLMGALLRIPVGIVIDRRGPKETGVLLQIIILTAFLLVWLGMGNSSSGIYCFAAILGLAGTSVVVALPLISRWYPDQFQGLALGIAGAASSGTVFAALLAPTLAELYGWRNVVGLACVPLFIAFMLYIVFAKDSDIRPPPLSFARFSNLLTDADAWWFMLFYAMAFGGVLALTSILVLYFHQQYGMEASKAGFLAAACVLMSSFMRPVGGWIADNWGGIRTMQILYVIIAVTAFILSFSPASYYLAMVLLMLAMASLGMGAGALFQLVPLRFRAEIGAATGMVGAAGAMGGFGLALMLAKSKMISGNFQLGFLLFAALSVLCLFGIRLVKNRWRTTWGAGNLVSARV